MKTMMYLYAEICMGMSCYKFDLRLLPDIFDNFFTKISRVRGHHTRSQGNHIRALRIICVDTSVKGRDTTLWNQLNDDAKILLHVILIYSKRNWSRLYMVHEWQLYNKLYLCIYVHQNALCICPLRFISLTTECTGFLDLFHVVAITCAVFVGNR